MDTSSLNLSPETLEEFCTRHQIVELALFGSAVRGELEPESDIDFLVTYAPERKFRPWGYIPEVDEMETLLGRKVDWLFRSAVESSRNPIFRKDVLSTAKVIYEKRSEDNIRYRRCGSSCDGIHSRVGLRAVRE